MPDKEQHAGFADGELVAVSSAEEPVDSTQSDGEYDENPGDIALEMLASGGHGLKRADSIH